jgi:hypothetical protein
MEGGMSRRERYNEGWHEGRRWAERDLSQGFCQDDFREVVREDFGVFRSDEERAQALGIARGYRDTVARFDSGELTWEMFDAAPLGR